MAYLTVVTEIFKTNLPSNIRALFILYQHSLEYIYIINSEVYNPHFILI